MLKQRGALPPDEAVFLVSQAARALDAAHRRGLVHRDVKPANLLIERGTDDSDPEHVYLTDFGITKHQDGGSSGLTSAGALLGTIDYIAPEQVRGMSVLGMADQYSLGCVLYECLTGRLPYEKDFGTAIMWAHVEEPPIPATSAHPGLPRAIDDVFSRVLAKRPGDRYDSCRAFMNDAARALGLAEPLAASGQLGMMPASGAVPYQPEPAPAGVGYLPTEFTRDRYESHGDRYESHGDPTASWPTSQALPPPPTPTSADPIAPPSGPGRRPGRRRRRGRAGGWLVAALALLLVAGAAAGVTLSLTNGHSNPQAGGGTPTAGGSTGGGATTSGSAAASGSATASAASVALPTAGAKIPVGHTPSFIQVAPNGKFAYITNLGTNSVNVLSIATGKVTGNIPIPQGPPQSLSFSPDSRTAYVSVYTTNGRTHLVAFIDTGTGTVSGTVQVNNFTPGPSATSPDGRFLYVPNHNLARTGTNQNVVDVIDLATRTVISSIPTPANPHWIVFDKKNGHTYISDHLSTFVTVLNTSDNSFIENIEVGETPHAAALSPDGSRLAVTSFDGNQVYLIDTATDKEIKVIPVGGNPLGVAFSPDGRYLFTVNNKDNSVTVIDTVNNLPLTNIPTGKAPSSIAMAPNGRQAYVTDENDGTVQILNLPK
jgi:serine/threonine-protein kinase